jgi:hypothetical protein
MLDPKEFETQVMREFAGPSQRALVIVAVAEVDDLLTAILKSYLLATSTDSDELFDGDAPLATFSAKIRLATRLNLIPPRLKSACNLLRKIRNCFAHDGAAAKLEVSPHIDRVAELFQLFADEPTTRTFYNFLRNHLNEFQTEPMLRFVLAYAATKDSLGQILVDARSVTIGAPRARGEREAKKEEEPKGDIQN